MGRKELGRPPLINRRLLACSFEVGMEVEGGGREVGVGVHRKIYRLVYGIFRESNRLERS